VTPTQTATLLQSGEPLPIGLTGAVVLVASLLVTAAWLLYLYR
jgi:hypothetical protein